MSAYVTGDELGVARRSKHPATTRRSRQDLTVPRHSNCFYVDQEVWIASTSTSSFHHFPSITTSTRTLVCSPLSMNEIRRPDLLVGSLSDAAKPNVGSFQAVLGSFGCDLPKTYQCGVPMNLRNGRPPRPSKWQSEPLNQSDPVVVSANIVLGNNSISRGPKWGRCDCSFAVVRLL